MTGGKTSNEWLAAAMRVLESGESNLRVLAETVGADPAKFYRGADLRGADLRGQDLRGMDFTGSDMCGALTDRFTRFGPSIHLAILGPPGVGKSTQTDRVRAAHGLAPVRTGDLLRAAIKAETATGLMAKESMERGQLIPDEIVLALIGEWLDANDTGSGVVFDGFPRTLDQAEALSILLAERGRKLDRVVELVIDEAVAVSRIVGRFYCAKCGAYYHNQYLRLADDGECDFCGAREFKRRPDDDESTTRLRMVEYRVKSGPVLSMYEAWSLLSRVCAAADVDTIERDIDTLVGTISAQQGFPRGAEPLS